MITLSKKRCKCGNQYEYIEGFLYCHRCDIDDFNVKKYSPDCKCDYCIKGDE